MDQEQRASDYESEQEFERLRNQIARNRDDIDALQVGVTEAESRADASEDRVDAVVARVDTLQARVDVDHQLILHLQDEGLISLKQADNLQEALQTSRTIATALGVVMASRQISDTEAFAVLSKCSQDTNVKLRVVAAEILRTGDMSRLQPSGAPPLKP